MADEKYKEYIESEAVQAAKAALEQQMAQKPGAYQSQWQNSLNEAMNKILNREKFTYDLNGDALYNQYKDQYVTQGKQAMMDTMGQASALTGGYGNSYAQSVGQQTFQGYLQGLNDKIPELYNIARNAYDSDTAELYNQYGLFADREDQDYGRYRDQLGDWEGMRDYLSNQYNTERSYDYGKYSDNRDFTYQQDRDAVADQQWQTEFDEAIKRFLATADPTARAYYEAYGKASEGGATGSGIFDKIASLLGGSGNVSSILSGLSSGSGTSSGSKSTSELAKEVIAGKWGNGEDRKKALAAAGYDYATVQAEVNKQLNGSPAPAPTTDGGIASGAGSVAVTAAGAVANTMREAVIADKVKNILDNANSSQFNPNAAIDADKSLSAADKQLAKEIAQAYIDAGYMKTSSVSSGGRAGGNNVSYSSR